MSIAAVQAGIRRRSASFVEDFKARGRGHSGGGYAGGTTPGLVAEGISRQRALMNHQAEQYRHFQGHVYAIVRTIANRVGAQHLRVGRKMPTAEAPTYRRRSRRIVGLNQKIYLKRRRKYDPVRRERSLRARLGMTWKDFVPKSFSDHTSKIHLLERHPLLQAFENPNPIMVKSTMMFVTVASLEITGKAYWWMRWSKEGAPQIWPIPSSWMEPHHDNGVFTSWSICPPGVEEPIRLEKHEVAYFSYPDPSNPLGSMSPMQAGARTVVCDEAVEEAQRRGFMNGVNPGLALTVGRHPETAGVSSDSRPMLTKEQRNQILNAIRSQYRGVINMEEPLILDALITDAKRITNTPREMDFLRSGDATQARLDKIWSLNPIVMGHVEGANRASAVAAAENCNEIVINPRIELISEVMTRDVGPFFAQGKEELVVYIEKAHAIDVEFENSVENSMMDHAAMSINEKRQRHNLPLLSPEDGDCVYINGQKVPVKPMPAGGPRLKPAPKPEAKPAPEQVPNPGETQKPPAPGVDVGDDGGALAAQPVQTKDLTVASLSEAVHLLLMGEPHPRPTWGKLLGTEKLKVLWAKRQVEAERVMTRAVSDCFEAFGAEVTRAFENYGHEQIYPASIDTVISDAEWTLKLQNAVRDALTEIVAFGTMLEWEIHRGRKTLDHRPKALVMSLHTKGWLDSVKLPGTMGGAIRDAVVQLVTGDHWAGIIGTVKQRAKDALAAAAELGKIGAEAVGHMVKAVFRTGAKDQIEGIATTEGSTALNAGAHAAREHLARRGLTRGTMWATQHDAKVRAAHAKMDGVIVPVGSPFNVEGHECLYPGDPTLPAAYRINCRCMTFAVA